MLYFNFRKIFKARGIDKPFSFLINNGYSANFATRIANSRIDKLNLKHIEKICIMLNCTPNDLLEWIPDKNQNNITNHPLHTIIKTDKVTTLTQMLNSIPLNKLTEIENIISEITKK